MKKELPCNPDHNGECLVCDCWLSQCPFTKEYASSTEKKADELKVHDVIAAKQGGKLYLITHIMPGMGGPYLTLIDAEGNKQEHDTSFDSRSATYTVKV